jgi:phosphoribosylformylglycinamidine synthase
VEAVDTPFTCAGGRGQVLEIPIGHNEGNYFCDAETLSSLELNRQILFRYTTPDGREDAAANPNGSLANIAGICNHERNVAGMMPHPERASEAALGSTDGLVVLQSMVQWFARHGGIAPHRGESTAAALQAR